MLTQTIHKLKINSKNYPKLILFFQTQKEKRITIDLVQPQGLKMDMEALIHLKVWEDLTLHLSLINFSAVDKEDKRQ